MQNWNGWNIHMLNFRKEYIQTVCFMLLHAWAVVNFWFNIRTASLTIKGGIKMMNGLWKEKIYTT